ncbi:OmpA family protein [Inquilinus sp. YAF38]|uniref:OmpA family protein n=1 Tax=Inquilinus sp. YAF38 TaxID=3233084 RepID=UPI003F91DB73
MWNSTAIALACIALASCSNHIRPDPAKQDLQVEDINVFIEANRLVFFETGSARLDRESEQIVRGAAAELHCRKTGPIEITGNTDRFGSQAGNQRLSIRRAEAVRDALIAYGVRKDLLVVRGVGETGPTRAHGRWGPRTTESLGPDPRHRA